MQNRIRLIGLVSLLFIFGTLSGFAQLTTSTNKSTQEFIARIQEELSVLETNKSRDLLVPLVSSITAIDSVNFDSRKSKTELWLNLYKWMDDNKITLTNTYYTSVSPPPDGESGIRYPSGVPPSVLKDPVARSNYEAAIKVNNAGLKLVNFQSRLEGLILQANSEFEIYLVDEAYSSSTADKAELTELLNKSKLSAMRITFIEHIEAGLKASPRSFPSSDN